MRGDAYRAFCNKVKEFQPDALLRAVAKTSAVRIMDRSRFHRVFSQYFRHGEFALPDFILAEIVKATLCIEDKPYYKRAKIPTDRNLSYLHHLYLEVDAETKFEEREDIDTFFLRSSALQFPSQGGLWQLIPRTLLLHSTTTAVTGRNFDVSRRFEEALGIPLASYTFLGASLFALAIAANDGVLHLDQLHLFDLPEHDSRVVEKFLTLVSTDQEGFLRLCLERCDPQPGLEVYDYNPLIARPVVRLSTGQYSLPVPRLLIERVTSGVYYDLASSFGNEFLTYLGHAYQRYIGRLLSGIPNLTVLSEEEYGPRKSRRLSPDWILTSGSRAVLLECKTKKLRLGSRLPQFREQFQEDVQAGIATAVRQLRRSVDDIRRRQVFPSLGEADLLPLVVTLDHAYMLNGNMIRRIVDGELKAEGLESLDYQVASTEEIESLAGARDGRLLLDVLWAKARATDSREFDLATAIQKTDGFENHPLLRSTYLAFLDKVRLTPETK
ncbi:MAG: hypothetical protein E6I03_00100 [Chloroflexi bacterium]|nr:MAG: hypothetical protein E6I03_00100 [Chloroflexota bacterium]